MIKEEIIVCRSSAYAALVELFNKKGFKYMAWHTEDNIFCVIKAVTQEAFDACCTENKYEVFAKPLKFGNDLTKKGRKLEKTPGKTLSAGNPFSYAYLLLLDVPYSGRNCEDLEVVYEKILTMSTANEGYFTSRYRPVLPKGAQLLHYDQHAEIVFSLYNGEADK